MCSGTHVSKKTLSEQAEARTQIVEQLVVNHPEHQVDCLANVRAEVHPKAVLPALVVVQLELGCGDKVAEEGPRGDGRR